MSMWSFDKIFSKSLKYFRIFMIIIRVKFEDALIVQDDSNLMFSESLRWMATKYQYNGILIPEYY